MTITLCGSMKSAKEMLQIEQTLEKLGRKIITPENMDKPVYPGEVPKRTFVKIKSALIRLHFKKIQKSDAVLVYNIDNKGINNYIGGSTFMEIAFAHVLHKKIFLYNPIPNIQYYKSEIDAMRPIIINGDLSKINEKRNYL